MWKVEKWAFCALIWGLWNKKSNSFMSIFLARPSWSFCTPKLWSGTKNEDLQRWSPSDQKWSFTVRKVEKWADLRAKMRPFEEKIVNFVFKGPLFSVQNGPFLNFSHCKWSFLIDRRSSLEILVFSPRSKFGGAKRPARTGREDGQEKNWIFFFQRAAF